MSGHPPPSGGRFTCDLCFPGVAELGAVAADLVLVANPDGSFALVCSPGHNGDTLVRFETAPTPDPVTPELEAAADNADGDELDSLLEMSNRWLQRARAAMANLPGTLGLRGSYRLVEELIAAGYDPDVDGDTELWLYDRCAQIAAGATRS